MGRPAGPAPLPRAAAPLAVALLAAVLGGCGMQRTLTLDSDPPGAQVWVDGVPRGTAPVRVPFVHPGRWHVRMEKPGHLSVAGDVSVATRTSDLPVLDLPSEVLGGQRDERRVLRLPPLGSPPDAAALEAVRERALQFRERARREVAEPGTPQPRGGSTRRPATPALPTAPAVPGAPVQGTR